MSLFGSLKTIVNTPDDEAFYSEIKRSKLVSINLTKKVNVVSYKPTEFDETSVIADELLKGNVVILNVISANREIARRMIDFLSGLIYAQKGQIKRISNTAFALSTSSVDFNDEFVNKLKENNIEF